MRKQKLKEIRETTKRVIDMSEYGDYSTEEIENMNQEEILDLAKDYTEFITSCNEEKYLTQVKKDY